VESVPAHASANAPPAPGAARAQSLRPLAISAAAGAALAGGTAAAKAEHRLGASLALSATGDAVFMSAPGIGLLPAHIVVRRRDLQRVLHALRAGGDAAAGGTVPLQLDVRGVRLFRPALEPHPAQMRSDCAQANIAAAGQWLRARAQPLGLGPTAAAMLAPGGRWLQCLAALHAGADAPDPAWRALVGRGAGTTPAGDDILVGALAYAWATQGPNAAAVAALRRREAEFAALTTAVGATYLRAAVRGEFGSHLLAWVRALPRAAPQRSLALARRVAGHGASSGYDTLAGFVAAAAAASAPLHAAARGGGASPKAMAGRA
jgi:hypothetical protein